MGNSPTDKGRDFIKSGMTLITEIHSDKLLKKAKNMKNIPSFTERMEDR